MPSLKFLRLTLIAAFALVTPIAKAVLVNHGPAGEYFKDTDTGIFWYDTVQFVGMSRAQVDTFQSSSPIWSWASSTQIEALLGKASSAGTPLENVMGLRQSSTSSTGPRWLGFYASTVQPDGWNVQSFTDVPNFEFISGTGKLFNVLNSGSPVGAWLLSTIDPVPGVPDTGSTALLLGAGLLGLAAIRRRMDRS